MVSEWSHKRIGFVSKAPPSSQDSWLSSSSSQASDQACRARGSGSPGPLGFAAEIRNQTDAATTNLLSESLAGVRQLPDSERDNQT